MKFLFYNFLLLQLFLYISTFDQEWNFKNASFNLLNESNNFRFKYVIYNKTISNYEVILSKTIYKNENLIKDENIIEITNTNNKQIYSSNVDWEDINNIIDNNNILHICPDGNFHPYYYYNNKLNNHTMYNFPDTSQTWNLKCYKYENILLAIYSNQNFLYNYNNDLNGWTKISLDFKLNDLLIDQIKKVGNNIYQLPGLSNLQNNKLALSKFNVIIDFSISFDMDSYNNFFNFTYSTQILSYFNENSNFYFIYNFIELLKSGYYDGTKEITNDNIQDIKPIINFDMDFLEYPILYILSIKNTKYNYYKVNGFNNIYYYGIIDIKTNQVLFNTKEKINKFIPFSEYSMLAITDSSAYEICPIRVDGKCIEKCDNDEIIINIEGSNYCKCNKYYFIPGYKCIDDCDLNIYTNNGDKCGLCKYLGGNKIYKLINTTECLEKKPKNTIFYNEDSLLLICDKNSHLENEVCVPNSQDDDEEKENEEKENEEEENEEKENEEEEFEKKYDSLNEEEQEIDYVVWILIISVSVVFSIITIFICIKLWGRKTKSVNDLLTQIDTDFEPKDSSSN